ncbi:competence protein ComEC [Ruminococcus albus SY3]|uniref:Competence protein ComEC n=1 Tax=Ruminococcus albus SY3 TaxID=1341156 RepID=A0A011VRD6_RUMAL|nr:ComEC/Rec2 family competence protein [Ruminococcus albus]EXM37841.1 competence protein ComEC [Ruminococcus albus SY3]
MTRKAAWAGVSFWAALMLGAVFRSEKNGLFLLTALGFAVIVFSALKGYRRHAMVCFIAFAVGIALNSGYTHFVYDRLIAMDGKEVTMQGYIKDISQIDGNYDRVIVCGKVDGIRTEISYVLPFGDMQYYDEISVTDTVSVIEDGVRFESGSYNYSKSVFLQGGYATGHYELSGHSVNPVFRGIREYRDRLFERIMSVCPKREGAFLGAMLCGDKSEMSPAMKTELYRSGLGHIFAVSGIHLVIAAAFFGFAVGKIVKAKWVVYWLTLAEIWGFAVFAGLSVSVVRAAVMMTVTRSGYYFGRKSDGLNSLGLCAFILTASKPYTVISPSFVLSFFAVAAIECVTLSKHEEDGKFGSTLRLSAAVLFMTAPASALLFGGVSAASVVTNLLLVPLCTVSLQICFIVLFTGGGAMAAPLLIAAALPVKFVLYFSDKLARFDFSYVFASSRVMLFIIIAGSVLMTYGCIRIRESSKVAVCTAAVLAVWCASTNITRVLDNDIRVTVLPDGKKSAYIISVSGRAYVFDVGCKGRLDSALQHQMDRIGIREMPYAFILDDGAVTAAGYDADFFLQPDIVFISDDIITADGRAVFLNSEDTADLGDMQVKSADDGFVVSYEECKIFLGKGKMEINGDMIDISGEKRPLEFDGNELSRI